MMMKIPIALSALSMLAVAAFSQPGRVRTSFRFFDAEDTAAVPKRLSQTGLFKDIGSKQAGPGIIPFEVNSPLWSDGAVKIRYFTLPDDSVIVYRDDSAYGFPVGTVFIKNFLLDTIQGDPSSRIHFETRLLVKRWPDGPRETKWYGFSYRWERDQKDAVLVNPETGQDTTVDIHMPGMAEPYRKKWIFPSQNACWRCHIPRGREVLGFFTAQLNRPGAGGPSSNRLQALVEGKFFRDTVLPDLRKSHRWVSLADSSQPAEARARSYLAANCSFCHGKEGFLRMGGFMSAIHDLDYFRADFPINYINRSAKTDYGIPGSLLVYGGDPGKSIFIHRMRDRTPRLQMPPLATAEPDTLALRVISEWIASLPRPAAGIGGYGREVTRRIRIAGGILHMDPGVDPGKAGAGPLPRLVDSRGRPLRLSRLGAGRFRVLDLQAQGLGFLFPAGGSRPAMVLFEP